MVNWVPILLVISSAALILFAGLLNSAGLIPIEAFFFIAVLLILTPIARVLIPIIADLLTKKKIDKYNVYECWKEVKEQIKKTTRTIQNMTSEYIPHDHQIIEALDVYVCEINPSNLDEEYDGKIEKSRGERRLIVYKIPTKKIIWETEDLSYKEFMHYIRETYRWMFRTHEEMTQQIVIPKSIRESSLGEPIVVGAGK